MTARQRSRLSPEDPRELTIDDIRARLIEADWTLMVERDKALRTGDPTQFACGPDMIASYFDTMAACVEQGRYWLYVRVGEWPPPHVAAARAEWHQAS